MNRFTFRPLEGQRDWAEINTHVKVLRVEDTGGFVVEDEDGDLAGGCIMDTWTKNSVQCHIFILNPTIIKYGLFKHVCDIVFVKMKRKKIIGLVPESCKRAIKLNKHLGFTVKTIIEDVYGDGNGCVIMELLRENTKFYQPEKQKRAA